MNDMDREYHELANIFPLMQGEEFEALKADIAENGLLQPIWIDQDQKIIDGRNRHRACIETRTPTAFNMWNGKGSLIAFVVSLNLHRRHLSSGQKATLAVELLPMFEAEAKERSVEASKKEWGGNISTSFEEQGKAREKVAEVMQTNARYVQDAKKLKEESPDLFEQVKAGEVSLPKANRENNFRNKIDSPPLPTENKFRIIYADPPWSYGNTGLDDYGHAERHYPSMKISELCELPIKELAEDNAVLFLWVTSPLLAECFEVIKAWGFKYKTSFVWDKIKHNYGHYNSVRHEMLLVCTKGSCTPDKKELFDSVQSIERSKKHSQKPQEFRDIIDTIYTHGNKIELFSRDKFEGWEVWGNEPA
jgi:N6-adenosine-specific RNA methylase IME4